MATDKEIKKDFKKKASKDPEKYYATDVLRREGFARKRCSCGTYFWTASDSEVCGDPACSGGFRFIDNTPARKKLDYIGLWKEFSGLFRKLGYTPIPRYPVVARWRSDEEFVGASIYDFQPYVVSGEVEPPANPLVVPQFCLRFNDIDNVGITGAHYTGFVMIGQHMFVPKELWDQDRVFSDIHTWLKKGLGLPNGEITFHEDAWAGGGNFGPCMEYFSRGLELGNQVYMLYEQTPSGFKELNLKVLDMGMGHERNAWFTQGSSTSYETTFPTVCKKLYKATGVETDRDIMRRFLPYASYLNVDEVKDINKAWADVACKVSVGVDELKAKILPLSALYSIADHSRTLLFALNDGALPGNVGGGYNLRVILRRALSFVQKYRWDITLQELCRLHADYLKPIFPELSENLDEVEKILDVEEKKFEATREKSRRIVSELLKTKITEDKLVELYDSYGISPDIVSSEAELAGKKVHVPDDFYAKIAGLHKRVVQEHETEREEKLDLAGIADTKPLYYEDRLSFRAGVLKVIGDRIILDQTAFYPTSGGQLHDTGTINGKPVTDVFKQGAHIVHVVGDSGADPGIRAGDAVVCNIDGGRRMQLAQHHSATHIVNAAARKILGNHVNQAGAKKTLEKAHLDITHYQGLTPEEIMKIERAANEIIKNGIPIKSSILPRNVAEKKYGMAIYQGGAVPGKNIRIIDISGVDVEACGGTHLANTRDVGPIRIIKTTKIQDGICRITFTAGSAKEAIETSKQSVLQETADILGVKTDQVPGAAEELFAKWKRIRKAARKGIDPGEDAFRITSTETFKGDALAKTAEVFKTQQENIAKTARRFMADLERFRLSKKAQKPL
ncbi:MAG: alanine--tRNA ligase [archaeon]